MGLALLPLMATVPAADATGVGVCTISGTITFSHSSLTTTQGIWTIEPGVIECYGLYNGYERFMGPGQFTGVGSYTALPHGSGTCLHHVGFGTVDYSFPTSGADIHLIEPSDYTLAGVGTLTTPSLRGTFQVTPPYEGDCIREPVTKALFMAEATLVRFWPDTGRVPKVPWPR
jgi:hypothetical protein